MAKFTLIIAIVLIASATNAHVAVDYPVGGEVFTSGSSINITWHIVIPHDTQNWDVFFSTDAGASWEPIQLDLPVDQLSLEWVVPNIVTQTARILVVMDNSGTDYQAASGIFEISNASSGVVVKTMHINKGDLMTFDGTHIPSLAFNYSSSFNPTNEVIHLSKGDTLSLTVVNNDTFYHNFKIDGINLPQYDIPPGDSAVYTISFPQPGLYRYFDDYLLGNSYLGLSGMLVIESSSGNHFFWNLREHEVNKNIALANGDLGDFTEYHPDYYTINGKSFPELLSDPLAAVLGAVGDTINIFICNSGLMKHSIHFHGFHLKVLYSNKKPQTIGQIKDTFPLLAGEVLELELVPDKLGEYPVHDHNLVAVTGGGEYPNGMLLIMKFE